MSIPNLVPWERRAYNFANNAHAGQLDDCGKNYFKSHTLHVVSLVKLVTDDPTIITTAYLHDTIEDTDMTYQDIKDHFLDPIADWVMELTHEGKKDNYGYYFPRLKTKECIMIKFADRLSNLSRMEAWNEDRQNQYVNKSVFWKDGSDHLVGKWCGHSLENQLDECGQAYCPICKVMCNIVEGHND